MILKTRLITSAVAIIFGIIMLILSDYVIFNLVISAISMVMLMELFNAAKCLKYHVQVIICFVFAALTPIFSMPGFSVLMPLLSVACISALLGSYIIFHKSFPYEKLFFMIASTVLISMSMSTIVKVKDMENFGLPYLILSLCGAWIADSGAYFAGTLFGKNKLCPEISPKKTVEGFIGGLLVNGIFFVVYSLVYVNLVVPDDMTVKVNYFVMFVMGILCAALGTVGDLTASLIKRQCGIKDYGNILPGHGGFFDRFDSVMLVLPFMYVILSLVDLFVIV